MQPPLFKGMLSWGSWVKDMLDRNMLCKKVVIVGASDKLIRTVLEEYGQRVSFYSEATLAHEDGWHNFSSAYIEGPVYLSIDKDVLNPASAATDWDQGPFRLQELEELLAIVLRKERVVGIDICGECSATLTLFEERREATVGQPGKQGAAQTHTVILLFFYKAVGYC